MEFSGKSIKGKAKKRNEDRFVIRPLKNQSVLTAVADGLGGQPAGDVAAQTAVDAVCDALEQEKTYSQADLAALVVAADREILSKSEHNRVFAHMGTTLVLAWCNAGSLVWAHAGDSRIYLLRRRRLTQVTRDQTMAQFLADEGEISQGDVLTHPMQGLLEQSLGGGDCEPESGSFDVIPGDRILICSDGLYTEVPDQAIESILNRNIPVRDRVRSLVDEAGHAGGPDDITVVVLDIN